MIVRAGTGWQTLMADLSIILFMVTAAALTQAGPGKAQAGQSSPAPSQRGEPIAVYRSGSGAPPLGEWLDSQPRDERQLLTIVSTYTPGKQVEALTRATALAQDADRREILTRVVVEPGAGDATATLAYDLSVQTTDTTKGETK
ncbi:MAG: hypothetical protein ACTHLU_03885 [Novosphingobium sp.]